MADAEIESKNPHSQYVLYDIDRPRLSYLITYCACAQEYHLTVNCNSGVLECQSEALARHNLLPGTPSDTEFLYSVSRYA